MKLKGERDIIWMKFTKDGYLGVVATSNDVNFDIPNSSIDYNAGESGNRKHTTSGIIIHSLDKVWNEDFDLVFPLEDIPKGFNRSMIESGIGNYLIENKSSILDFYSHNY